MLSRKLCQFTFSSTLLLFNFLLSVSLTSTSHNFSHFIHVLMIFQDQLCMHGFTHSSHMHPDAIFIPVINYSSLF